MTAPLNAPRVPPYKRAGLAILVIVASILALIYLQFRGDFERGEQLTVMADRSGLAMDRNSKVTYNGVEIGRVSSIEAVTITGQRKARITADIAPRFTQVMPRNVTVDIKATTVFGNKYIAFSSPKNPDAQRITSKDEIQVSGVTTEFNTLFETVVSVAKQVDPVKLNQTLTATAQALDGLGERFGQSIGNGNAILDQVNPLMPRLRQDNQRLAELADVYANAAPDLFDGLQNLATTAHTLNDEQHNIDQALMASVGFGNTGGDIFERSAPYLVRGSHDFLSTAALFDEYSPALLCTIRNWHDLEPKYSALGGGANGYSVKVYSELVGVANPYVYPDNLPRVNAHGGPEGRPGCWQPVTRDLWPMPYLVMDTGASIAPYNHLDLGQPTAIEYMWGRQIGENTINP